MSNETTIQSVAIPPSSNMPTKRVDLGTIMLLTQSIVNKYPIRTIRENESMWIYDDKEGFYKPDAETYIKEFCAKSLGFNARCICSELLFNIGSTTYVNLNNFESDPYLINLKNGVYDINKDIILEHSPKYNFRYCTNMEYDKSARCDRFEKMVRCMTKSQEDYDTIQKWFGCHFVIRQLKKSLFIVGPTNTSKSTLLWVLQQLIGDNYCSAHSLQDLTGNVNYSVANLYNKLANINADTSTMRLKDISIFKLLTGGDLISTRMIRGKPFQFRNNAKLTFAFNHFPFVDNFILSDLAFWERIMIVSVKKGYDQKDDHIKDKLYEELPGIFNWAIEGLRNFLKEDIYNRNIEETKDIWVKHMIKGCVTNRRIVSEDEIVKMPSPVVSK